MPFLAFLCGLERQLKGTNASRLMAFGGMATMLQSLKLATRFVENGLWQVAKLVGGEGVTWRVCR